MSFSMRPLQIEVIPVEGDADGIADGNASHGATVTLDGVLTAAGSYTSADGAHQISIKDGGVGFQSGATFTVIGTDAAGNPQSEGIAGPNFGATVQTTASFLTVTSVTITNPVAVELTPSVDVGTIASFDVPVTCLNYRCDYPATVAIQGSSGTAVTEIQETFGDLAANGEDDVDWWTLHTQDPLADAVFAMTRYARGIRINITSFVAGAQYQLHILQAKEYE